MKKRLLSGITPSGDGSLHIGNYLGAVKQFITLARPSASSGQDDHECFLMVADLHALTTVQDRSSLIHNTETLILNELSLLMGELGPSTSSGLPNVTFFRQSDVPMHTEFQSILNNVTPLGLIKRAHAYKDKLQNQTEEDDVNMGLFNYPILMAADILIYKPDLVPVGKDQKQHIEITRDIAERFNKIFPVPQKVGPCRARSDLKTVGVFPLPEAYIPEDVAVILGTDGKRKMSKSLGNLISIFDDEEIIRKQVMGTYTDPTRIHVTDPGHVEGNMVLHYLDFFGESTKVDELKKLYTEGKVSDIEVKNYLFESLMKTFAPARKVYQELKAKPEMVERILGDGAAQAGAVAAKTMSEVRDAVGLVNRYSFGISARLDLALQGPTLKTITIDDFSRVELRVGKVIEASNKEGSEKLIRLVVDFGPSASSGQAETRIIFTGVRGFGYVPSDFLNKQFFFITNLAPRKMMDEESQGMILAVDGSEKKPVFVSADGLPIGAKIR